MHCCSLSHPFQALEAAFIEVDAECKRRYKRSGTTATVAIAVGWELLVANVGDSCAYLDTGAEILQLSCNHRVSENTEERHRILAAGGEGGGVALGGGTEGERDIPVGLFLDVLEFAF